MWVFALKRFEVAFPLLKRDDARFAGQKMRRLFAMYKLGSMPLCYTHTEIAGSIRLERPLAVIQIQPQAHLFCFPVY